MKRIFISICIAALLAVLVFTAHFFGFPGELNNAVNIPKANIINKMSADTTLKSAENKLPSEKFHLQSVSPEYELKDIVNKGPSRDKKLFNIYVDVASRTLHFNYGDETLKTFRIACGSKTGQGDKVKEGDYRTPRGQFYICTKAEYSPSRKYIGSRWMLLSYPGKEAAKKGIESKAIDKDTYDKIFSAISKGKVPPQNTPLGSAIGIHGGAEARYPRDWTAGCIGMYDEDVEEIYEYVSVGTKVIIR